METRPRRNFRELLGGSAGWLFADLLLALAMLFLAANTIAPKHPVPARPTPTSTAKVTPTPRPLQGLERKVYKIRDLIIDPDKLLGNDSNTKKDIFARIKAYPFFKHRKAGLLIVYGGAPTVDDVLRADDIAARIYNLILELG